MKWYFVDHPRRTEDKKIQTESRDVKKVMAAEQALTVLQQQREVLGITNPVLQKAIIIAIGAIKAMVWHDANGPVLPMDGQVVLAKGKQGVWLYRYHSRDNFSIGFFRLSDNIDSPGIFDETVTQWKET